MSIVPFGRGRSGSSDPFSLHLWDPFLSFPFNTPFAPLSLDLWNPLESYPFGASLARPSSGVEWKETPEAHLFRANLPGVREEEVQVEVDGQTLQISGGGFLSRFSLPETAKVDHLRAGMEHGLLLVAVPKVDVKKPEVTVVEISG
uniref:18. class I heat shock protein n=1 Tax=Anthurium amnicola TaxID=1678845 RepID=A0A1D1Y3Q2_9ARAE